jgi:predicted amidohydrolase YtcJ
MRLYHRRELLCRAVLMYDDRMAYRLGSMGIQSSFGNDRVRVGGCKVILDGSLSSKTGYMSRPYAGGESMGMLLMEEDELHHILKRSYTDYIWAAVHAIGDRAVEIALRCYERIGREVGVPKLLKRIEHAQSLKDEDIGRFPEIGVIPVVNPIHIPFDRHNALNYLGPDARLQHRLRSLIEAGADIAIGSDAPVGAANPLHGIYAAAERKDFEEGPELRFYPHERISLSDAVYAYTMGSAAAIGMESSLGSLEEGKLADFVVLSKDIFSSGTEALRDCRVELTVVGGRIVHDARGAG